MTDFGLTLRALLDAAGWALVHSLWQGALVAAAYACFAALVLHTWLYAAFLEDPMTWTLLALGSALAAPALSRREPDGDVAAALNGHRKEHAEVARSLQ